MLNPIIEMPKGAIGFVASGRVTGAERRKVLEPVIASALADGGKVRLLYLAGADFAGYDSDLPWDDGVFGTRHFTDFERIAFVADNGPYDRVVQALEGLMPTQLRTFATSEIASAKEWLAG
jgi:hypothetical protein